MTTIITFIFRFGAWLAYPFLEIWAWYKSKDISQEMHFINFILLLINIYLLCLLASQ